MKKGKPQSCDEGSAELPEMSKRDQGGGNVEDFTIGKRTQLGNHSNLERFVKQKGGSPVES